MARTVGAKNRTPEEREAYLKILAEKPKGKRGRPVGSKNKSKEIVDAPVVEKAEDDLIVSDEPIEQAREMN